MPRCSYFILLVMLATIGLAMLLPGCQRQPLYTDRDLAPLVDQRLKKRSLTFDTPAYQHIHEQPGIAWWQARYDTKPVVHSGYQATTFEQSHTRTIDRQHISGRRVFDRYHSTTHRHELRQGTR